MKKIVYIFIALVISVSHASAQQQLDLKGEDIKRYAANIISKMMNDKYPFLDLSYITPSDSNDDSGYAVGYDWSKEFQSITYNDRNKENIVTQSYNAKAFAKGNHTFGDATNNKNLSKAGISIGFKRASLGALKVRLSEEERDKFLKCMSRYDVNSPTYIEDTEQCGVKHRAREAFLANQANQWVYGLDALARIEADEGYSQKQVVYGVELSSTLSPHPDLLHAKANVLDLPFYVVRKAFSKDDTYRPHWPLIRLGVHTVDVKDNDAREAVLPGEDRFERAYGEIAFNTVLAIIKGKSIKFNVSYEIYKEISPEDEIKSAGLDDFEFFSASIQVPASLVTDLIPDQSSFFIRYTDGELPFDRKSTKAFEIGWRTNLNLQGLISNVD